MIDAFVRHIQTEKRYSALTVRNYRHDIESFATWCASNAKISLEEFDLTNVTTEDIREWIVYRMEHDKVKAASMNRELSSLRSFYKYLRQKGAVEQDIFKRITTLRTPKKLPTFVPETRMETLLDDIREESQNGEFIEVRNALIISLFYGCGIRLAELQGIHFGDFSADMATLRIRGKGDKHRILPLQEEVGERVKSYAALLEKIGFSTSAEARLIVSNLGKPLSRTAIQGVVKSKLNEANVQGKKSPHVLRHTFATHLMNRDADMRDIQELMGHSSLRSTQCYTHNSIAQLQEIYKRAHPHK